MIWFAVGICAVALVFDFFNGFHDAANSIATVVSTRVLSPRIAVVWAAFFNFVAAFGFGTAVAKTMGQGMIRLNAVNLYVILAGLLGAIVWDVLRSEEHTSELQSRAEISYAVFCLKKKKKKQK